MSSCGPRAPIREIGALRKEDVERGHSATYGYYADLIRFTSFPRLHALDGTEPWYLELFDWRPALPHLLRGDLGTTVKRLGRFRPPSVLMPTGLRLSDDLDAHQADLADAETLVTATLFVAAHAPELMPLRTRVADFIARAEEEIRDAGGARGKRAKKTADRPASAGRDPKKPMAEPATSRLDEAGVGAASSDEDERDASPSLYARAQFTAPEPAVPPVERDSGPSVYSMAQDLFGNRAEAETLVGEGANVYTLCVRSW